MSINLTEFMTSTETKKSDILDDFFALVDAQPAPKKRGRPKSPKAPPPPPKPVQPLYIERPDALISITQRVTCMGCNRTAEVPSHITVRYREYTPTGKLRTYAGQHSPVVIYRSVSSLGLIPRNLPVHEEIVAVEVIACAFCLQTLYEGSQLTLNIFDMERPREYTSYQHMLEVSQEEDTQAVKDLRAHSELEADAQALPKLAQVENWFDTLYELQGSMEFQQWLNEREKAKTYPEDDQ